MLRRMGAVAVGLALGCGAAVAQAQTAVAPGAPGAPAEAARNDTAAIRRILSPAPGVTTFAAPPREYPPLAADALGPNYVEPAAPALARRPVTNRVATAAPARTQTATVRRTVTRPPRPWPAADQALALSPAQRQYIYRTIASREPDRAPGPPWPSAVARTETFAPPAVTFYPLHAIYPADDGYRNSGNRDVAGDPPTRAFAYRNEDDGSAHRNGIPLPVGARIPPSVPLVAVPQPVASRIPATRPYRAAVLDHRVYLVEPATGVIVAVIAQ
jgi:hypothetical protein